MNFLKKLSDKVSAMRTQTKKWPEQAQAHVDQNRMERKNTLMMERYQFINSMLKEKNLPLYESMDIFLEQFEEKQKKYHLIKEEFIHKNKSSFLTQEQKDFFMEHNDIWFPFLASQDGIINISDWIISDFMKNK